MNKNSSYHKRNSSQGALKLSSSINNKKCKSGSDKNKPNNSTLSLIEKSNKRVVNKHTIIEELNEAENSPEPPFFAFGRGAGGHRNWHLNLDEISEAQDSNSRREFTSYRSARDTINDNKENFNTSNIEDSLGMLKKGKGRPIKIKSKEKYKNKSRNERTKSTVSLSRTKYKKDLELRTEKIEKSMKMLWECIGELWENNRVCQYKSEKNGEVINGLGKRLEEQEQRIFDMKFEISKIEKLSDKAKLGLRG